MSDPTRKTIRQLTVVVETEGLTEKEHERRVSWVEKNLQDAGRLIESAFVSMVIYNDAGGMVGIFGSGTTPPEEMIRISEEIIERAS